MKRAAQIEFGDFQTPLALARTACRLLVARGEAPNWVVEPTCGVGGFLTAAAEAFPRAELRGWDINPGYVAQALAAVSEAGATTRSRVVQQDFFAHDWEAELADLPGRVLILGNPPWVTNAAVTVVNGSNLPSKENFLGLRGLAARTGKANFDISEWMLIRLLRALRSRPATIAMLCKTATARKWLRYAWQNAGQVREAAMYRIDAAAHFGAAVDACLLVAHTGSAGPQEADVFASLADQRPVSRMGLAGQDLVADIPTYRQLQHLEGLCPFRWRSGLKHDCASVMELRRGEDGRMENKLGERTRLEPNYLYPLLKCTDLAHGRVTPARSVLVTQRRVGEDTSGIAGCAPLTWHYLESHRAKFTARKSSIYVGRMPFALFGIGDYAFAPWKVAVSGLHRSARFQVVGPVHNRPVCFDDTCYYTPFEDEAQARLVAEVLNSECCQRFLHSLIFAENKRPITVELLQRLNVSAIAEAAGYGGAWRRFQRVNYQFATPVPQMELLMETATPTKRPLSKLRKKLRAVHGV